MQVSAIESLEVSLLDRLLHHFDQLSESRKRLQELLLELLALIISASNDGTNLCITSTISLCSTGVVNPSRFSYELLTVASDDQTISSPVLGVRRFEPLGPTPPSGIVVAPYHT